MRHPLLLLLAFLYPLYGQGQVSVTEVGKLPVSVSNNAVCEGFIDQQPYLFSFGGIDSTKKNTGIHLKSYRYNIATGKSQRIADLPDTLGKIAAGASQIDNIIYIVGGYHVFSDRSELSSNKVHRYDVANNTYLSDGPNLPTATDDHVQAVWRGKLLYVVTGWSDVSNIALVQVYNPSTNTWAAGTPVPNSDDFKSFGASGSIIGDTIYYFGGASSASGFRIQKTLRKGVINPDQPTEITWTLSTPSTDIKGYRMAATTVGNTLHWLGGSGKTYNYNGIAYNGSGGVAPTHRDLSIRGDFDQWTENFVTELPMDLRGIAQVNDTVKYLAGGMIDGQTVTHKVYQLTWPSAGLSVPPVQNELRIFPNPVQHRLLVETSTSNELRHIEVYTAQGKLLDRIDAHGSSISWATTHWPAGVYFLKIFGEEHTHFHRVMKQ